MREVRKALAVMSVVPHTAKFEVMEEIQGNLRRGEKMREEEEGNVMREGREFEES
jgi:hypothetical protein